MLSFFVSQLATPSRFVVVFSTDLSISPFEDCNFIDVLLEADVSIAEVVEVSPFDDATSCIESMDSLGVSASLGSTRIIPSLTRALLNVARVFLRVMQKPFDAGMSGNSGRIVSSVWNPRKSMRKNISQLYSGSERVHSRHNNANYIGFNFKIQFDEMFKMTEIKIKILWKKMTSFVCVIKCTSNSPICAISLKVVGVTGDNGC